jgi:hypothetical protein
MMDLDIDCLINCLQYLDTNDLLLTCSLVNKQFNQLTMMSPSWLFNDRYIVCRNDNIDMRLLRFIERTQAPNIRIEVSCWLQPVLLGLHDVKRLQVCCSIDTNDMALLQKSRIQPNNKIRSLDVRSCKGNQIALLDYILSRTNSIEEIMFTPSRFEQWQCLHEKILQQKNLAKFSIGKVKMDDSFMIQLFEKLPLTSFESNGNLITSEMWGKVLSLPTNNLKHLSIVNTARERRNVPLDINSQLSLETLEYQSGSSLLESLLRASAHSLQKVDITFTEPLQLGTPIQFSKLKSMKLVNVSPATATYLLSGCTASLKELTLVIRYDDNTLPPVDINLPQLHSITSNNIPPQLLTMILRDSQVEHLRKLSIQFPKQITKTEEHKWNMYMKMWKTVNVFEGEMCMFENLSDEVLSGIGHLKIHLPLRQQRRKTVLDENLLQRLAQCRSATGLDLAIDFIAYHNSLGHLLDAMPCLHSLALRGPYPIQDGLPFPRLNNTHAHLTELCFDYSGLTPQDMEDLLVQLPNLSSIVDAKPQSVDRFYHLLSLVNGRTIKRISSIVGPNDFGNSNQFPCTLFTNNASVTLLLDSRLTFEELMLVCICGKYNSNYSECCSTIDLLNAGNLNERESKLYYEARALALYCDLVEQIENIDVQTRKEMKERFEERGLPPCVKRLIDLLAPAIC